MNLKDIILIIISYCSLRIVDKLITDNLPDLKYKNIAAGFQKHIAPLLVIAALGYFSILSKLSKDKEVQKTYFILLTVTVAAIALQKLAQNKKPSAVKLMV